mgnify:CR=1 FL=1
MISTRTKQQLPIIHQAFIHMTFWHTEAGPRGKRSGCCQAKVYSNNRPRRSAGADQRFWWEFRWLWIFFWWYQYVYQYVTNISIVLSNFQEHLSPLFTFEDIHGPTACAKYSSTAESVTSYTTDVSCYTSEDDDTQTYEQTYEQRDVSGWQCTTRTVRQ